MRGSFLRALVLVGLVSSPVAAADPPLEEPPPFRLVWLFGDDDVLHPAEVSRPPSPAVGAGDRAGYDPPSSELRGRFTGRENLAFLEARAEAPAFVCGLTTRAVLWLGADLDAATRPAGDATSFFDLGSYVELEQELTSTSRLALRLYPLDGDVERVGVVDALAFGGAVGVRRDSPYREANTRPRAARLSLHANGLELFASLKTATFLEPAPNGTLLEATSYGVFAGVTSDVGDHVRLGASGGHFEHGPLAGGAGAPATTSGVALRASFGVGVREPPPAFAFGPDRSAARGFVDFIPNGFALGVEWVALGMRRARFEQPAETRLSPARGGALLAAARAGVIEARAAASYREPELVVRNAGGVFPGLTLPLSAAQTPELSFLLFPRLLLHPSVAVGVAGAVGWPAAVMTFGFDRLGSPTGASLLARGPGDVELLPPGHAPVPVFEARPTVELELSRVVSLSAWLSYRRDGNRTRFLADFEGTSERGFADPDFFGYGVALSGGR